MLIKGNHKTDKEVKGEHKEGVCEEWPIHSNQHFVKWGNITLTCPEWNEDSTIKTDRIITLTCTDSADFEKIFHTE